MAITQYSKPTGGLIQLANPTRFMAVSGKLMPWMWAIAAVLVGAGLYFAFPGSPAEYRMGEGVRIMYVHVPSVWLAMLTYVLMTIAALGTLVWKHPLADVTAKSIAPIAATFTLLGLITGSLWGRPAWGTYWEWDPRLTSFLLLFLICIAIVMVYRTIEDPGRAGRIAAIVTLVGAVNIPIIHFSVEWWNSIHQDAGILEGRTEKSFIPPLLFMLAGYTFLFIAVLLLRMRSEIRSRRLRSLQMRAADMST